MIYLYNNVHQLPIRLHIFLTTLRHLIQTFLDTILLRSLFNHSFPNIFPISYLPGRKKQPSVTSNCHALRSGVTYMTRWCASAGWRLIQLARIFLVHLFNLLFTFLLLIQNISISGSRIALPFIHMSYFYPAVAQWSLQSWKSTINSTSNYPFLSFIYQDEPMEVNHAYDWQSRKKRPPVMKSDKSPEWLSTLESWLNIC